MTNNFQTIKYAKKTMIFFISVLVVARWILLYLMSRACKDFVKLNLTLQRTGNFTLMIQSIFKELLLIT